MFVHRLQKNALIRLALCHSYFEKSEQAIHFRLTSSHGIVAHEARDR